MLKFEELIKGLEYFGKVHFYDYVRIKGQIIDNAYEISSKEVIVGLEHNSTHFVVSMYVNGEFEDCEVFFNKEILQAIAWVGCKIQELGLNE